MEVEQYVSEHCLFKLQMKNEITSCMQKKDGPVRLLLATEAYGMGTDAPDIRRVIHIGPPTTIESK